MNSEINLCKSLLRSVSMVALSLAAIPAQADVIYNFTSEIFNVQKEVNNPEGTIGATGNWFSRRASLTFSAPLAANTTTHLDYKPLDFVDPALRHGNLTGYHAQAGQVVFTPITSDISAYITSESETDFYIDHYSSVIGDITTDASGNISDWDLTFQLYKNAGATINKATYVSTPAIFVCNVNTFLHISSISAVDTAFFANIFNGAPFNADYHFNTGDEMFEDYGGYSQFHYYTAEPGHFTQTNTVPLPAITWLFCSALPGLWLTRRKDA